MDQQIAEQIGLGGLALVIGISGWLLPFEWNALRLRRGLAKLVSDEVNRRLPKIIGTILALAGAGLLIGTAVVGPFE